MEGGTGRHRRRLKGLVALAVGMTPFVVAIPPASAGVNFLVIPTLPSPVIVGQSGLPGTVSIDNQSTGPDSGAVTVTITAITVVPSCGTALALVDCPTASVDPGVYGLSPTGAGEPGTACAGTTFGIELVDPAQGKYRFVPDTPVVLTAPGGPNSVCRVNFLVDVLKAPAKDSNPATPGLQTAQLGGALGTSSTGSSGAGAGGSSSTVVGESP
ncbi:MAG: hypothetical protein ACR2HV_02755 [Acidimicrobiales bacterium]